jgi:TRAP-type C4-dicarboxylate transport system permease large subunit
MTAANLPMGALFRAMVPFLLSMFACMLIIALFPAVSLWLPGLMAG